MGLKCVHQGAVYQSNMDMYLPSITALYLPLVANTFTMHIYF